MSKDINHLKISDQSFSKYIENKCNFFNDIFRNFKFGVYFTPPLHGDEKHTISDINSTTEIMKSKRVSGDTVT